MSKRSYIKKSNYWLDRKASKEAEPTSQLPAWAGQKDTSHEAFAIVENEKFAPKTALGGCSEPNGVAYRNNVSPVALPNNAFPNLSAGISPFMLYGGNQGIGNNWNGNGQYGYVGAGPLGVATQAYWNISVIRNAINMMVDFSCSNLRIKTDYDAIRKFFNGWFDATNMDAFMRQYFLEYYRSGNVFIYKFNGKIDTSNFNKLQEAFSATSPNLPIRYVILNPLQVFLQTGANVNNSYVKALSPYEITRLRSPQTPEDKQVLDSLPPPIQKSIKEGGNWLFVTIPLDPKRLLYTFYRKQDYEPLAVPMVYPVLMDVEFKLALKKLDMSLASTLEQVVLLVTTGRNADQYNMATGKDNVNALQKIFQNQTIGRVLVADHTTKAEWKIPDLKELLGNAKYERVDRDIKEGLQFLFFGDEKFANLSIKAEVFVQSLNEGRRCFIQDFLMPEVKKICAAMNFKQIPTFEFENIELKDKAVMSKLFYQMGQLGLLTADEVNEAINTGELPTKNESIQNQEEYKKLRDKGLYTPMIGAPQDGGTGRPGGKGTPAPKTSKAPIGQSKAGFGFGAMKLAENLVKLNEVCAKVETALGKRFKVKELNEPQKEVAKSITKAIVFNEPEAKWQESVAAYVKNPKNLSKEVTSELEDLAIEFETDLWQAALLKMSKVEVKE